jgi:hypothetical protein
MVDTRRALFVAAPPAELAAEPGGPTILDNTHALLRGKSLIPLDV